ncbi:MarR family transcriptional regulator [Mesorhizobium sp. M0152]|uniref:MarR family winged helix-turn-helix transcriptional regulator n=1 Tax=unclassified Mesorhizobium TaxID=325217 RepID=UPI00333B0DC0
MSPEEELRFLILGAQREGNRLLAEMLSPLGVTPSQGEVISCLSTGGEMSLSSLGKLLVCETGSPSRLVDTLVGRGIVDRRENALDRRQVTLALTEEGKQLAKGIVEVEDKLYGWVSQRLGAEGIVIAVGQLRHLVDGTPSGDAIARRKLERKSFDEPLPGRKG